MVRDGGAGQVSLVVRGSLLAQDRIQDARKERGVWGYTVVSDAVVEGDGVRAQMGMPQVGDVTAIPGSSVRDRRDE